MGKYKFQSDDEEVIRFLDSLGRKRSVVLNSLIKYVLEENDGYLPPAVMADTGFTYKKASTLSNVSKNKPKKVKVTKPVSVFQETKKNKEIKKEILNEKEEAILEDEKTEIEDKEEKFEIDKKNEVPSGLDMDLIKVGLDAFGI